MNAELHPDLRGQPPQRQQPDAVCVRAAFAALIEALGLKQATDMQTATRAAELWLEHLLAGQNADLSTALGVPLVSKSAAPVVIEPLGFHLVCPHHLTVASGHASIAYLPDGYIVGFGRLVHLVRLATARVALQEDVACDIAQVLAQTLGARAVAVRLRATHACHRVLYPRSHDAQASTWGLAGHGETCVQLQALIDR